MKITSSDFEAYLKCPMKCWLRTTDEPFSGGAYANWVKTQQDVYRATIAEQLHTQLPIGTIVSPPATCSVPAIECRGAPEVRVQVQTVWGVLESELSAVECISLAHENGPADFIPIRSIFTNKVCKDDKLLLSFDAFVLSESLGRELRVAKIIHGDNRHSLLVRVSMFTGEVRKYIERIAELLSSPKPPDLILNRHCSRCEFRDGCRLKAKQTDDLSSLSGMSERVRARHRSKGIFTVTQLSYTFRPRRTPKRAKNPARAHDFALHALSIRENCIYIHGSPELPECRTQVYLDIEGLPDRDFYYLIGIWIVSEEREDYHHFWANRKEDEATIFLQLAEILSQLTDYRVFHFGNYDAAAIKRVAASLPESEQERFEAILPRLVNVLSLVHSYIYFPTYSNGLKEIMPHVGGDFVSQEASGLDSVVWRMRWESEKDSRHKARLLEYNQADCTALRRLTNFITYRISMGPGTSPDGTTVSRTEDMKLARPRWQLFAPKPYALQELQHVSKSAYFDYQREKIFIRTHPRLKCVNRIARKNKSNLLSKPDKTTPIELDSCPNCRSRKLRRGYESSHIVVDLKFSKKGIKRLVTRFVSWRYSCEKCGAGFRSEKRAPNPQKYGHGLASWCVYQNNVLGVNMSKIRRSLLDLFGLHLDQRMLDKTNNRIASSYETLYAEILKRIVMSPIIHIDETTVKLRKARGYVWVLTTFDTVYYFYRPTRQTEFLREMLASFRGVLVSDFYSGYDFLPCEHQKCLVHLVRDIDDDLLRNPLDEELKGLTQAFGNLLRSIVSTIDKFGLRRRNLKKHKGDVDKFMSDYASKEFASQVASKYGNRMKKYGARMFTFLDHDGVPWNNNNAEHAIKRFAKYRQATDGRYSEKTLKDYLIVSSILGTCEFNSVNILKFLLSGERSLDGLLGMVGRNVGASKPSNPETATTSALT